jgi:hypothetical protein
MGLWVDKAGSMPYIMRVNRVPPMIYLLNSSVIPAGSDGTWQVKTISNDRAIQQIKDGFTSAVGHDSTAELMASLLGVNVPVNRISVKPQPGDILLCFRLKNRAPEGVILSRQQLEELGYEWVIMLYLNLID